MQSGSPTPTPEQMAAEQKRRQDEANEKKEREEKAQRYEDWRFAVLMADKLQYERAGWHRLYGPDKNDKDDNFMGLSLSSKEFDNLKLPPGTYVYKGKPPLDGMTLKVDKDGNVSRRPAPTNSKEFGEGMRASIDLLAGRRGANTICLTYGDLDRMQEYVDSLDPYYKAYFLKQVQKNLQTTIQMCSEKGLAVEYDETTKYLIEEMAMLNDVPKYFEPFSFLNKRESVFEQMGQGIKNYIDSKKKSFHEAVMLSPVTMHADMQEKDVASNKFYIQKDGDAFQYMYKDHNGKVKKGVVTEQELKANIARLEEIVAKNPFGYLGERLMYPFGTARGRNEPVRSELNRNKDLLAAMQKDPFHATFGDLKNDIIANVALQHPVNANVKQAMLAAVISTVPGGVVPASSPTVIPNLFGLTKMEAVADIGKLDQTDMKAGVLYLQKDGDDLQFKYLDDKGVDYKGTLTTNDISGVKAADLRKAMQQDLMQAPFSDLCNISSLVPEILRTVSDKSDHIDYNLRFEKLQKISEVNQKRSELMMGLTDEKSLKKQKTSLTQEVKSITDANVANKAAAKTELVSHAYKSKGYELASMSSLSDGDKQKAEPGKIYLTDKGGYVVRDAKGKVHEGKLPTTVDVTNLPGKLKDPNFKSTILDEIEKITPGISQVATTPEDKIKVVSKEIKEIEARYKSAEGIMQKMEDTFQAQQNLLDNPEQLRRADKVAKLQGKNQFLGKEKFYQEQQKKFDDVKNVIAELGKHDQVEQPLRAEILQEARNEIAELKEQLDAWKVELGILEGNAKAVSPQDDASKAQLDSIENQKEDIDKLEKELDKKEQQIAQLEIRNDPTNYHVVLVTAGVNVKQPLDINELLKISEEHGGRPVLIKDGNDIKICGFTGQTDAVTGDPKWDVQTLDKTKFAGLTARFPANAGDKPVTEVLYKGSGMHDEIASKKGHVLLYDNARNQAQERAEKKAIAKGELQQGTRLK